MGTVGVLVTLMLMVCFANDESTKQ
jgi:hypothetical protein